MNIRLFCDNVVREVALPSYLHDIYGKIAAQAGDAAIVMLYGWSTHDRTDISVVAPAKIELALEDVVLATIPKDAGEVTAKVFHRGRQDKVVSLTHSSDGQLHTSQNFVSSK